ncbi:hypothetical protein [Peribacillus simplex]|uniref:hypothetical protein n=1 Tax=Peribacillus simplex TaxID=1478 RepID=UPI003D28D111
MLSNYCIKLVWYYIPYHPDIVHLAYLFRISYYEQTTGYSRNSIIGFKAGYILNKISREINNDVIGSLEVAETSSFINEQKGKHFDPSIVESFCCYFNEKEAQKKGCKTVPGTGIY